MKAVKTFWQNNKGVITFLFLLLFFRSAVADWYHVPSGSMKPSILIGDRVWVDKLAYDVKIPLTDINLNRHAEPNRGDIIVFNSAASNDRLIKRVIAVPGDVVAMQNNQLYINQQPLSMTVIEPSSGASDKAYYQLQETAFSEAQASSPKYQVQIAPFMSHRSSFAATPVPPDYFWVMGDNRDNSADSRVIGLVPRSELVGRAERVIISFDKDNYYLPRAGRYFEKL